MLIRTFTRRATLAIGMALFLGACAGSNPGQMAAPKEPIGDFKLGIVTVFAKNVQKGPLSREASIEELESGFKSELQHRFGSIEGSKFYNIALSVDAYVLAQPGIPLIAAPKSGMVVSLNVWDDAKSVVVTEEHKQFTVLEKLTGGTFLLGSGLTLSKEEQLAELTRSAVDQIEAYLRENPQLFTADAAEAPAE